MKLKVVCQNCGHVDVVDTTKIPRNGEFHKVNEMLPDLADWLDYEFWLCSACEGHLRDMGEYDAPLEDIENFFKAMLEPTQKELEGET